MSFLMLTNSYRFINIMTISGTGETSDGIFSRGILPTASLTYQVGLLPTMQTSLLPQQPIIFLLDKFIGMFLCILHKKGEKDFAVVSTHCPLLSPGHTAHVCVLFPFL